jgi:hypothetical protein
VAQPQAVLLVPFPISSALRLTSLLLQLLRVCALAAADIIEAINVPANTVALTAGIEVISALVGESQTPVFCWVLLVVMLTHSLHPGTQLLLPLVLMLLLLRLSPLCSARLTPSTSKSTLPRLLRPQVLCVSGLS